jgi:putative oxidoreductase
MKKFEDGGLLISRVLLSVLFIVAGYGKITGYTGTAAYMASMHVPSFFLPLVILLELGGGLAIVFGFLTRFTALFISGFTIIAAIIFHNNFSNDMQQLMFMKDMSIAGGFLILGLFGAGKYSLDNLIFKKK